MNAKDFLLKIITAIITTIVVMIVLERLGFGRKTIIVIKPSDSPTDHCACGGKCGSKRQEGEKTCTCGDKEKITTETKPETSTQPDKSFLWTTVGGKTYKII
jgi:hypothetical protein